MKIDENEADFGVIGSVFGLRGAARHGLRLSRTGSKGASQG